MKRGKRPGQARQCSKAGVGVRTPPQGAGAQSRLGSLPGCRAGVGSRLRARGRPGTRTPVARGSPPSQGGGPGRTSEVGGSLPPTGMCWRRLKQSPLSSSRRARGSVAAGCGGLRAISLHAQDLPGALRRAAPPGAGEEDGSREGEPGEGTVVLGATLHSGTRWSCAPWRGGGEAGDRPWLLPPGVPRVTAAAAILPHTDPPQRRLTAACNVTAHGAGPPN